MSDELPSIDKFKAASAAGAARRDREQQERLEKKRDDSDRRRRDVDREQRNCRENYKLGAEFLQKARAAGLRPEQNHRGGRHFELIDAGGYSYLGIRPGHGLSPSGWVVYTGPTHSGENWKETYGRRGLGRLKSHDPEKVKQAMIRYLETHS